MHHISHIEIHNFRSIVKAEFCFSIYTPLVGYNNAGKTNVLQALNWAIRPKSLLEADFYESGKDVTVIATISGVGTDVLDALAPNHRQKIEPLVRNGQIRVRRSQTVPNLPAKDIKTEIWKEIAPDEEGWAVNPSGIDAAIVNLFPETIFIGAMEDASEDVGKYAAGTTIGKLIKEIIDPVTVRHSQDVNNTLQKISKRLSAQGDEKDETLVDLDKKIQTELQKFFPEVIAKIHIQTPTFVDFIRGATIKLFDNHNGASARDVTSFGHGAQRSVQIALIKCLSDIKKGTAIPGRTTLLLIDEPELYLHPQAIEVVRAALTRLSREGYQVAFSTHSANMIARDDAANTLLIRRNSSNGTFALPRIEDKVKEAISDAVSQAETLFSLTNSSKILFSERALLAEGKTENTLLPEIFSHEFGLSLAEDKLGLIPLGGSGNIHNSMTVLDAMGIPTKALADLDFVFRYATKEELLLEEDENIRECKRILRRLQTNGIIALDANTGLPKSSNVMSAAKCFELLAADLEAAPYIQAIHEKLLTQGVWIWKRGTIETHLGLSGKTHKCHMDFLGKFKSEQYQKNLPDYEGVKAMLKWVRKV